MSKPSFLEILDKTRNKVYTVSCIAGAWRKARCWPIQRSTESYVSNNVSANDSTSSTNTPNRLRVLSQQVEKIIRKCDLEPEDKDTMYELIDYAGEKVTKYRDITPRADTLKLLRSGKLRREKKRARHIGGEARVLTAKLVNEGLQRIEEEEEEKLYKQQLVEAKKHWAEERKILRETLDKEWRINVRYHNEVMVPRWRAECAEIDIAWAATKQLVGRRSASEKKPPYPPRLKRPLKPKSTGLEDISIVVNDTSIVGDDAAEGGALENDELVESMHALGITHFAEVNRPLRFTSLQGLP